jgi:preprotein translocase subunit SecA
MRRAYRHERSGAVLESIAAAKHEARRCTDLELLEMSASIRHRLSGGEDWVRCFPEASAAVAEAAARSAGTVITDSQVVAGMNVLQGAVAELRDGEGKGIAAILAAYVSALAGLKVHVVTLDDYLARRDLLRAQSILGFLGISTGLAGSARRRGGSIYSEITYGSYVGFAADYLEDNMATSAADPIQDENEFAIIDEADTILIDEARCCIQIITNDADNVGKRRRFVRHSQPDCRETPSAASGKILAECRVREFFRIYSKIAGLTGTAVPAAERFRHFYRMEVASVPASVPDTREDREDLWYGGTDRLLADLEMHAIDRHNRGQPVLIRAGSGDICREISRRLLGRGVAHVVLRPDDADAARAMAHAGKMGCHHGRGRDGRTRIWRSVGRRPQLRRGGKPDHRARR